MKNLKLFGCPLHLGVSDTGIIAGIDMLNKRFCDLGIEKINEIIVEENNNPKLKNLNSVVATCTEIARQTDSIIKQGKFPIFIGGDHASSIGTVSGVASNYEKLGLLWVDSHADINTDETTLTGNIHGMPVSALLGCGHEKLTSVMYEGAKISTENVVLFGLRDIDPLEFKALEKLDVTFYTYNKIKERGLKTCLSEVEAYLSGADKIHLSFDLDSMNPDIIKGVSVPAKNGFDQAHAMDILHFALNKLNLSSIDIVEYNERNDTDLYTSDFIFQIIQNIRNFYSKE